MATCSKWQSRYIRRLRPGDERDVLAVKTEVQKVDVFHMKNLYEWMHDYLEDENWKDWYEHNNKDDRFEHYYMEKRMQSGHREQRSWWRVYKFPWKVKDGNQYMRYTFQVNFRNLWAKKIEVVHKGKKASTWRGDLALLMEAWVQLDYLNKWVNHWLMRHFERVYRLRVYHRMWKIHRWDVWRDVYRFTGWIKQYLDIKVPFKLPESFHPIAGINPNPEPSPRGGPRPFERRHEID